MKRLLIALVVLYFAIAAYGCYHRLGMSENAAAERKEME